MKRTWKTGVSANAYFKAFESAGLPPAGAPRHDAEPDPGVNAGVEAEPWPCDVLTTFTSYGTVPLHRQAELIRTAGRVGAADRLDDPDVRALIRKIRGSR